jgi:hypothetical protein
MADVSPIPGNVLTFLPRRMDRFFGGVTEQAFAGRKTYFCNRSGIAGENIQLELGRRFRTADPGQHPAFQPDDYTEIIARDRVLRTLPVDRALRMIHAMWDLLGDLLDRSDPRYCFSLIVDHYMLDLLARQCRARGIRLCMCCSGVVQNTMIMTTYGEYQHVRDPSEEDLDRAIARLSDDGEQVTYAASPKPYSTGRHLVRAAKWWGNHAAFSAMGLIGGDRLNYRYLCATSPSIYPESAWTGSLCQRYFDPQWSQRISRSDRPPLFIPLGFTPEATTDYWLRDLRYLNYEQFITDAAARLSEDFLVVVKDHWAALGKRPWQFYRALSQLPGVVVVPAEVKSRQVMQRVKHMLVGAGTAGIEGALRGIKVATLDRPYYHRETTYLNLCSADRVAELPQLFSRFAAPQPSRALRREVVRRMLEPTLVGSQLPPMINRPDNLETTARSLRIYLDTHPRSQPASVVAPARIAC